ncbi:hypothetical protein BGX26_005966 [Mortierella sp. AD094]|nr:hypothetical protein BGX26_005966 [Mortierella sp. AD094]
MGNKTPSSPENPDKQHLPIGPRDISNTVDKSPKADQPYLQPGGHPCPPPDTNSARDSLSAFENNPQGCLDQPTTDPTPTRTQELITSPTLKSPSTLPQKRRNPLEHKREFSKPLKPMFRYRSRRRNHSRRPTRPLKEKHLGDICLGYYIGPVSFTSKSPRRLKRLHTKFHKHGFVTFKVNRNHRSKKFTWDCNETPSGNVAETAPSDKDRQVPSTVDATNSTDQCHAFTSKVPLLSRNDFPNGLFLKHVSDKFSIPLLRELSRYPSVIMSETIATMPVFFSRLSPSPSPSPSPPLSSPQPTSSQPPIPSSPPSATPPAGSFSSWKPWLIHRDLCHQSHYYWRYLGGGVGGGDSSNDDDPYFSSDDDESDREDGRHRGRNNYAHRNRESKDHVVANVLASTAAFAASATASANAFSYSSNAARASANVSSALAAASSKSAALATASAATVFAFSRDPSLGAATAFQWMVALPSASLTPTLIVPTSNATQSRLSSVTPIYGTTSDIHTAIPAAAPTYGTTFASRTAIPTTSAVSQGRMPVQFFATPILDFIELADSSGIMDADLFGACYIKAIDELDFTIVEDLERFKRLNILAEHFLGPLRGALSPIEHSQPNPEATSQAYSEDNGKNGGDFNNGNTAGDNDDDDDGDGYDDGDDDGDNDDNGHGRNCRGGCGNCDNNPSSGDNDDDEYNNPSRSWSSTTQSTSRSILKRKGKDQGDSSRRSKRNRHRRGPLEFKETMEVQYYNPDDVARVASVELSIPVREALRTGLGRFRRRKRQSENTSTRSGRQDECAVQDKGNVEDEADIEDAMPKRRSRPQLWIKSTLLDNDSLDDYEEEEFDSKGKYECSSTMSWTTKSLRWKESLKSSFGGRSDCSDSDKIVSERASKENHDSESGGSDKNDATGPGPQSLVDGEEALRLDFIDLDRFQEECRYLVADRRKQTSGHTKQKDSEDETQSSHLFGINDIMNYEFNDEEMSELEEEEAIRKAPTAWEKGKGRCYCDSDFGRSLYGPSHICNEGPSEFPIVLLRPSSSPSATGWSDFDSYGYGSSTFNGGIKIGADSNAESNIFNSTQNARSELARFLKRQGYQKDWSWTNGISGDGDRERSSKRAKGLLCCETQHNVASSELETATNVMPSLPVPQRRSTMILPAPGLDDQDIEASEIIANLSKMEEVGQKDHSAHVNVKIEDEEVKLSEIEDYLSYFTTFPSFEPTPDLDGSGSGDRDSMTSMPLLDLSQPYVLQPCSAGSETGTQRVSCLLAYLSSEADINHAECTEVTNSRLDSVAYHSSPALDSRAFNFAQTSVSSTTDPSIDDFRPRSDSDGDEFTRTSFLPSYNFAFGRHTEFSSEEASSCPSSPSTQLSPCGGQEVWNSAAINDALNSPPKSTNATNDDGDCFASQESNNESIDPTLTYQEQFHPPLIATHGPGEVSMFATASEIEALGMKTEAEEELPAYRPVWAPVVPPSESARIMERLVRAGQPQQQSQE